MINSNHCEHGKHCVISIFIVPATITLYRLHKQNCSFCAKYAVVVGLADLRLKDLSSTERTDRLL